MKRRVELSKVDTTVVSLENIFDSRERVVGVERAGSGIGGALAEPRYVPDANGLVHAGRDDKIVLRMEGRGHDVVRMASQNRDALAGGAIPNTNRLIVRA